MPKGDWTLNTPMHIKHTLSVHRILCKKSVDAIAICKIVSTKDDYLETDVHPIE
jgi:hypothetical protein